MKDDLKQISPSLPESNQNDVTGENTENLKEVDKIGRAHV